MARRRAPSPTLSSHNVHPLPDEVQQTGIVVAAQTAQGPFPGTGTRATHPHGGAAVARTARQVPRALDAGAHRRRCAHRAREPQGLGWQDPAVPPSQVRGVRRGRGARSSQ
eukprot:ctg_2109.g553